MNKQIVMLVLHRRAIAGLLTESINKRPSMEAFAVYEYGQAAGMAMSRRPNLVLMEIPERQKPTAHEILGFCEEIGQISPGCKIVLLCPEDDKESVNICIDAKQKGKIEDFLFYDFTPDYLAAKLESLHSYTGENTP